MMKRLPVLITAVATLALILGGNALLGWSTPTKAAGSATITMSSYPGDQPSLRSGQSPPPCVDNLGNPIACLQLDMDPTNGTGPCNPVDATTTVTVGSNHDVAVCLTNAGAEPNAFSFDLVYDDALNLCVPDTTACTAATRELPGLQPGRECGRKRIHLAVLGLWLGLQSWRGRSAALRQ